MTLWEFRQAFEQRFTVQELAMVFVVSIVVGIIAGWRPWS